MRGRKLVHHAEGILVGGVGQLAAVEHADAGDVVPFDAAINPEPLIGPGLFLVVVDVRVARIPSILLGAIPAAQRNLHLDGGPWRAVRRVVRYGSYSVPRSTSTSVRPRLPSTANAPSQKKNGVPGPRLSMESGGWEKLPVALRTWTLASSDSPVTSSIIVPCRVPIEISSQFATRNSQFLTDVTQF